jgi:hypothetical protein
MVVPIALVAMLLCAFTVIALAFVGIVMWAAITSARPLSQADRETERTKAERFFEQHASSLLSWQPTAFTDMLAAKPVHTTHFLGVSTRGVCPSRGSNGRGWFAYWMRKRGGTSIVFARTSAHAITIEITDGVAHPSINGEPLGRWSLNTGEIRTPEGDQLGHCHRPPTAGRVGYAFIADGQTLATLHAPTGTGLTPATQSLVANLVPNLSIRAEHWLLALCVMELALFAPRFPAWRTGLRLPLFFT